MGNIWRVPLLMIFSKSAASFALSTFVFAIVGAGAARLGESVSIKLEDRGVEGY